MKGVDLLWKGIMVRVMPHHNQSDKDLLADSVRVHRALLTAPEELIGETLGLGPEPLLNKPVRMNVILLVNVCSRQVYAYDRSCWYDPTLWVPLVIPETRMPHIDLPRKEPE